MSVVINQVTYALPVRSFLIDYSVSQSRQLPVVKEFVVRLLYSLGSCTSNMVQDFFGFSESEMLSVMANLEDEKLICWDESNISLSSYARDRFENVDGKVVPRFFEVNDALDSVSFELKGYKLISDRVVGRHNPSNIEIQLNKHEFENISDKAKSAFDARFVEFQERIKNIDVYSEHCELYKINSVLPKSDRMLPLKVNFIFSSEEPTHPIIDYADEWVEEWDDDNLILGEIAKSLENNCNTHVDPGCAIQEYLRVTYDPFVSNYVTKGGVDLPSLMGSYFAKMGNIDVESRMIVGNLYCERNETIITQLLEQKFGENKVLQSRGAIWSVCTDDKLWGRTADLQSFIERLNERFDSRYRPGKVVLCLDSQSLSEARKLENIYNNSSALIQGVNKSYGNSNTEVFLIPDMLLATVFHMKREGFGNLTIPVGYVTTDEKYIKAVQGGVRRWIEQESNFNSYFLRSKPRADHSNNDLVRQVLHLN